MALRVRGSSGGVVGLGTGLGGNKDVKKSSYYVWYLGSRETKGVDAMPSAIDYLLERERLQEPYKVTLQVSGKGLKIIQTVHPGGSLRSALKHLVPGHAVLAAVQREDVVAATLLLPNPASNNPVHVHAYRCDSVETAELLGGQLKLLAMQSDAGLGRLGTLDTRLMRGNMGSDGRSTRESESSEGSGELRHAPIQSSSIYESLAAELRAKLGRSNADNDSGPILLPPRDYDTVHRQRGNLTGIELRRCLNQAIVGSNGALLGAQPETERPGTMATTTNTITTTATTRSGASSGIGSDSAATPPPYQLQHHPHSHSHSHPHLNPLGPRTSRPSRDSSSDEDWGAPTEELDYPSSDRLEPTTTTAAATTTSLSLPRLSRSPERIAPTGRLDGNGCGGGGGSSSSGSAAHAIAMPSNRVRRSAELRQRSPSPQYQPRLSPGEGPRERFHDAKELFRQMEREAIVARFNGNGNNNRSHRSEPVSRQSSHEEPPLQAQHQLLRRQHQHYLATPVTPQHYQQPSPDVPATEPSGYRSRPRPRTHYEVPFAARELRGPRNNPPVDSREVREFTRSFMRDNKHQNQNQQQQRPRPFTYGELAEHERYPGLDRESARPALGSGPTSAPARYRHSYAEPPRLGLAALHPY